MASNMLLDIDIATFGYVICEHCLVVVERKRELEPLPRCKCERFMEVLLCDECEEEASFEVSERGVSAASHYCREHVKGQMK